MVHVLVARAVAKRQDRQGQPFLPGLVLLVVEHPAQVHVAQVVLELVEPGLHVGPILGQPGGLVDVAQGLAQQAALISGSLSGASRS